MGVNQAKKSSEDNFNPISPRSYIPRWVVQRLGLFVKDNNTSFTNVYNRLKGNFLASEKWKADMKQIKSQNSASNDEAQPRCHI